MIIEQHHVRRRSVGDATVWPVGLGCAEWSLRSGFDERTAARTLHASLDAGITLIDTAHAYATVDDSAHNERIIGRVLSERNDVSDVVIATKGGHFRSSATEWGIDGRPATIRAHCDESLRALRLDSIPLYFLHKPDPAVPLVESVGAMEELRRDGKIRMIGLSNVSASQLAEGRRVTTISAVENRFSPFDQSDRDMVDHCDSTGCAYLAYSPLGGGSSVGTIASRLPVTAELASELGYSVHRVLLAWHLKLTASLIPVAGANRPVSATDSAAAPLVILTESEWSTVNAEIASVS